jgi:hypothetical protein
MNSRTSSLPTYDIHSPFIWLLAHEARDRAKASVANDASISAVDAIAAIILSAAASEGFINELSELCIPRFSDSHSPAQVPQFAQKIQELEQDRSSSLCKYLAAAPILSGTQFNKGENPYQDFALLFDVRNAIMHIKAFDQSGPREG